MNQWVSAKEETSDDKTLGFLWKVMQEIRADYIDKEKTSMETLVYGAIKGMLEALDDPHTTYLSAEVYRAITIETKGFFGGLGIYVDKIGNEIEVVDLIEQAPAWKAGIRRGDIIRGVEGNSVYGMSLDRLVFLLKGVINSSVNLSVWRESKDELKIFKVTRAEIKIKSVVSQYMAEEKMGYIKIRQFSQTTLNDFKKNLKDLLRKDCETLIIDLRFNPGGLLESVCEVADLLLSEGQIVYTKNRHGEVQQDFRSTSNVMVPSSIPIVVLINGYSASASEILAGALRANGRAILLGETTFGKFSVQEIREIDPRRKTAYKMTTAHYYLADGKSLHLEGLEPDIKVSPHFLSPHEIKIANDKKIKKIVSKQIKQSPKSELIEVSRSRLRDKLAKEKIEEKVDVSSKLIDFLLYREMMKNKPTPVFEIRFDPQLSEAVRILKSHELLKR